MARVPANPRQCRPWSLVMMIFCGSMCLVREQVAAHEANVQGEQPTRQIAKYELKFQNELDNSTVLKHLRQQQVFKCQARLAPLSQQQALAAINSRLRTTSSWLTGERAREKQAQLLASSHDDPLNRMLQLSWSATDRVGLRQHRSASLNVTHFSIDWFRDDQRIGSSLDGELVTTLNVTLKTQNFLDKTNGRSARVDIKNTLNGQQMKLTSRLRLGHLKAADSAKYKCIARVTFFHRLPEQLEHQQASGGLELVEFTEQSLESSEASLIVVETNATNEGTTLPSGNLTLRPRDQQRQQMDNNNDQDLERSQLVRGNGPDNEVRQQKTVRPQLHSDDTQDETEPANERASQHETDRSGQQSGRPDLNSLFEDDEDLFRLDSSEFISRKQPQADSANDDTIPQDQQLEGTKSSGADSVDSQANDLLVANSQQQQQQQHDAYFDWILDNGEDLAHQPSSLGESLSSPGQQQQQRRQSADRSGDKKIDDHANSSATIAGGYRAAQDRHGHQTDHWDNQRSEHGQHQSPLDHGHQNPTLSVPPSMQSSQLFPPPPQAPFDPRRTKLGLLVHKIVPEPSCYTGRGEFYRGNSSTSHDQRVCLNWLQVLAALEAAGQRNHPLNQTSFAPSDRAAKLFRRRQDYNHNYCRNPNGDRRGPWCFVVHSDELDGILIKQTHATGQSNQQQQRLALNKQQRAVRINLTNGQVFVGVQCQLASCSEYLWLYVVAPPLGLLVLLICLITVIIRSIRKSHYNSIFTAAYQRHNSLDSTSSSSTVKSNGLLGKLLQSRKSLAADRMSRTIASRPVKREETQSKFSLFRQSLPFASSSVADKATSKRRLGGGNRGKYLNEDIFEVVDDIDWSEGQPTTTTSQSISPSESFKMHSTADMNDDNHHHQQRSNRSPMSRQQNNWHQTRSTLTHSKSINPMYDGHQVAAALDLPMSRQFNQPTGSGNNNTGNMTKMSKSKSQAGPMFATLRWHVRNVHQNQRQFQEGNETGGRDFGLQSAKKSSLFTESCADSDPSRGRESSKKSEAACDRLASSSVTSNLSSAQVARTDPLISCSSTSDQIALSTAKTSNRDNKNLPYEEYALASELPRLDASNVTLAYNTQPIYEGKFSQVQMAYIKQRSDDLAQATGKIGAQVAVCSLKQQAALDESVFYANELRVRNLNHLNILKLLGYVQLNDENQLDGGGQRDSNESSLVQTNAKCSLVYDMAHMIDLSDWLKEQCKDAFDAQNDCDLALRQNLTCLAKQIALAIDYLHDKNIIYKDLACRNCFLDVTRMLVKLASFNIEPEFDAQGRSNGSCSNDYYSTANDDELISKKLSLKSMVRPKYLLDYYVIDSRPAECQLLPLSWLSLESILFNKFNKHTDIWSFGCLMYELFSLGEVAYFGYSSKQVIDSVRSNMMPPQPLLCPNGIYKLMCKCLSDIPTLRPNIKHVYEQLNLYSGQCSSFLNHHLCII